MEIRYGKELIICDAGTGIYPLGQTLIKKPIKASILISHYHWDHIIGLPFFAPFYDRSNKFQIIGRMGLKKALNNLFRVPNFPVKLNDLSAQIKFNSKNESKFKIGLIKIESFNVNHPNGAFGYKLIFPNNKVIAYIPDNGPQINNVYLINKINGADLLIHDAQFLPNEHLLKKRFGHSTFNYVLDLARHANVKKIALFHHDLSRTDKQLTLIEKSAQKLGKRIGLKSSIWATREGKVVLL